MEENNSENKSENNNQGTQNVTPKAKKLTLGSALIIGGLAAYLGWGAYLIYNKPLIYLRPHVEQTVERTVNGISIQRREYKRFDGILDGKNIHFNYAERGTLDGQPELNLFVFDRKEQEFYSDDLNDGKVDSVHINGNVFEREENLELFEQKVDPKFAEYKQRLNVDQVVARKLQEPAPTIEELLSK